MSTCVQTVHSGKGRSRDSLILSAASGKRTMISGLLPSAEAAEKSLWSLLESIPGAEATAENARHIPTIQTYSGKCRAWIRLALMQRELADFVAKLVDMDVLPQVCT